MTSQVTNLHQDLPTIVIAGRPNVGKSTLFNRIVERRLAIEARESGVTRDRVTAPASWRNRRFLVVDTGGLGLYNREKADDTFDNLIREQLLVALETADRIVLVVDAQEGLMPLDKEVARVVREAGKEVIVAVNKADNPELELTVGAFAGFGFEHIVPVSSLHKVNFSELLDVATEGFPESDPAAEESVIKIALVGRPNVGKSSIVNRLLGEERVMVSDVPGTTRDSVDVPIMIDLDGVQLRADLIDTAGLRRRGKVDDIVEHFSSQRTERAIQRSDIVLVCLDATQPATAQDKRICRQVADAGKACILLVNKWDLAETKQKELLEQLSYDLPFMNYAPVQVICARSGYNFSQIMPAVVHLTEQLKIEIPTSLVNQVLKDIMVRMPAPAAGTGVFKVYYGIYKSSTPPTFLLFVNKTENIHVNYEAYLRNQLRLAFGFEGLPVRLEFRNHHPKDDNRQRYQELRKGLQAGNPRQRKQKKRRHGRRGK